MEILSLLHPYLRLLSGLYVLIVVLMYLTRNLLPHPEPDDVLSQKLEKSSQG